MKPQADKRRDTRPGDTLAWLWAAFQVIGPILLALIVIVALAYGVIHFVFLA